MKLGHFKSGWIVIITTVNLTLLSGCATLSKQQCLTGNWQSIGFEDGAAGRSSDFFDNHNQACSNLGVVANYSLWEQGRQQGLKQYCSETNAYQTGRNGSRMASVCPTPITAKLQQINAEGRHYYSLNKQLQIEQRRLDLYRQQYDKFAAGKHTQLSHDLTQRINGVNRRIENLKRALAELQTVDSH